MHRTMLLRSAFDGLETISDDGKWFQKYFCVPRKDFPGKINFYDENCQNRKFKGIKF